MTQPPSSKSPINEQIADILLTVVMTGSFGAGGFGAIWSLFKESDVPKAIASAAIGVGLAYGAKLLLPVHKGTERRLSRVGEAIDARLDEITENMVARASGYEAKYLLCQALECQSFRSEGVTQQTGIFIPLLKEVFVPLSLSLSELSQGFKSKAVLRQIAQQEYLYIWSFLQRAQAVPVFRQIAILAWGGYGKTTLLKHVAYLYGRGETPRGVPKLIPFLLVLRDYRDILCADDPPNLPELIERHHIPELAGAKNNLSVQPGWASKVLRQGRALVMFDGFDEVPYSKRSKVAKWITLQMKQYGQSKFIVASRPKAYQQQSPVDSLAMASSLWVKDFDEKQRRSFIERWYQCQERYAHGGRATPDVQKAASKLAQQLIVQIESEPDLRALAKNPLLLNMITTLHRRNPGRELPKRKAILYQEICQLQLKDRPEARKLETLLTECEPQVILQEVAIFMMQKHLERIEYDSLVPLVKHLLESRDESISAEAFIKQVVEISELLIKQEHEYEFAHLSFQEYLAAAYIAERPEEREAKLLYGCLGKDWWKATVLLYASKVKKPAGLIREAKRQGQNDLAYECWQQTTKRIDESLQAELEELQAVAVQVKNARYGDLERYLQNGEWQKADKETYRLMITEVGKEEGQWFDPDDLLNFPCEPLKIIDGLWVRYSEGKFGFSVQKKIYVEKCGGIPNGQYDREAFSKLYESIGWNEIRYDLTSPTGHLPKRYEEVGIFRQDDWTVVVRLFSRIQTCKL